MGQATPLYYTSPSLPGAHRRARPGGGRAVHHEQIIARPDQPGPWKGVSALIAGS